MELKAFVAKNVSPGEPLTAQAWNDIVGAVDGAYKFLQSTMHVVKVRITTPGLDPADARVVAVRASGPPYESVRPAPPSVEHTLVGLEPGSYTLLALAAGYSPASSALTIADAGETTVELAPQPVGPFMPDLFGQKLHDALAALAAAQIPVSRLLDFNGTELAANDPGVDNTEVPVLVQSPSAGTPLAQGSSATLVVAVPVRVEPTVEVPSLAGLTQAEAQKALEAVGLILGRVENRQAQ